MFSKIAIASSVTLAAQAKNDGQSLTPPMGWMSWMYFRCNEDCKNYPKDCINEENLLEQATILSTKYKPYGYDNFHIDDCYLSHERNAEGEAVADPTRFPNGMKAFGEKIHALGLKYGMYSDTGAKTCGGYPGVNGEWTKFADKMKEWEVDYLKLDSCYVNQSRSIDFTQMSQALTAAGRDIVFSCSWPAYEDDLTKSEIYPTLEGICHLWRNYNDIQPAVDSRADIINYWARNSELLSSVAGPGRWNDPDMLVIGNKVQYNKPDVNPTLPQMKIQFALWATIAAPMIMGNDLRNMSAEQDEILMNRDIIAISQNKFGRQGKALQLPNWVPSGVWVKPLDDSPVEALKEFAMVIYNTQHMASDTPPAPQAYRFTFGNIDAAKVLTCTELFTKKVQNYTNGMSGTVSDVLMFYCIPATA